MIYRFFFAFLACINICVLSASGEVLSDTQKNAILNVIRDGLKDPDAAKFKWDSSALSISPINGFGQACLSVNAKNGYGGYVGFQTVYVNFFMRNERIFGIRIIGSIGDDRSDDSCRGVREDIERIKNRDSRLTEDQARAGCSIFEGKLFCASPGTGMCWEKGHNPLKGEAPSRSIDIGNSPSSPNFNHTERCG